MADSASRRKSADQGGVKETLESILVAFVLAFIFRAFVVEAFVIPTGSMAPTLLGAHLRFRCPDCGYRFTVNYSSPQSRGDDINIPTDAGPVRVIVGKDLSGRAIAQMEDRFYNVYCPNCGYQIDTESPADADDNGRNPPVFYGDRILVLKYAYLFNEPRRWDVVVFKSPYAGPAYTVNYIKRLIGKPGETIMVLDGDIYTASGAGTELSEFKIQRKPSWAQEAMWRIAYDNDYHPVGRERVGGPKWTQPWTQTMGSGWSLESLNFGRSFAFNNLSGQAELTFNPAANGHKLSLTEWLGYGQVNDAPRLPMPSYTTRLQGARAVSDVKLDFFYQRQSGEGPLRALLGKRDMTFIAELTPGQARLFSRQDNGVETIIGQPIALPQVERALRVEFSNVDYQVTLKVDGKELIQHTYNPDLPALLKEFERGVMPRPAMVRLSAANQTCTLSHVSLWRDIYYNNSASPELYWGMPRNFPDQVIHLGKEEFFVLGDNSLQSLDARYWRQPVRLPDEDLDVQGGRVPGRFMLGKAFFVYWPAGFRPAAGSPSIVPNFGDMRSIH